MKTCSFIRTLTMSTILRQEALETLKANPYFEKYSKKILAKEKLSPEKFYSQLEEHMKKQDRKIEIDSRLENKPFSAGEAKSHLLSLNSNITNLNNILKVDLIKERSKEEIKKIWEEFHRSKESTISAAVPVQTFNTIQKKAQEHPIFLLPLPRNGGYEFILLQFNGTVIHFTPLISYQTHKENAPECLTIVYYPELSEEKDIVLMKGEYDKNIINSLEAQCLANQLQIFYAEQNEKLDGIMRTFTHYPNDFKHMDLIAEIECISV